MSVPRGTGRSGSSVTGNSRCLTALRLCRSPCRIPRPSRADRRRLRHPRAFLIELTLDPPNASGAEAARPQRDEDYLILLTIHSAKGQEWDGVFVLNLVDGCIGYGKRQARADRRGA